MHLVDDPLRQLTVGDQLAYDVTFWVAARPF